MKIKFSKSQVFSILIANMIGTGVFTSLGFQVEGISSGFAILLLWIIGGLMALLGALSYSMLALSMPQSGGEYHYLTKIYSPVLGFLSGWVSLLIGFSAPVAAAASAFGSYILNLNNDANASSFFGKTSIAIIVILGLTLINLLSKRVGGATQNVYTFLKITFIIILIFLGFRHGTTTNINYSFNSQAIADITNMGFLTSIYFITYSYSGWNAICYIADEVDDMQKNLPKTLILGVLFVSTLYILLNTVFLNTIPINELKGQLDVGNYYAAHIFSPSVKPYLGTIIALLLLSTINSMIIVGPRVSMKLGEDHSMLNFLSKKSKQDIPYLAIILQSCLSIVYIVLFDFSQMIICIGMVLNLFTLLSVIGIFVLAKRDVNLKSQFKKFGYPIIPALFIGICFYIVVFGFKHQMKLSFYGLLFTLSGVAVYYLTKLTKKSI